MRRWALVCAIAAMGCGSSNPASPGIAQVAGTWSGTETIAAATGGPECLVQFQTAIGAQDSLTMVTAQNNATLASTTTSTSTGQTCTYSGTAGMNSMTLTGGSCAPASFRLSCNGNARDIYLASRTFTGAVNGSVIAGTTSEQWDVFVVGDTSNNLGVIRTSGTFTVQR